MAADLIHLTYASLPLIINVPTLVSPAEYPVRKVPRKGLAERLRSALGQGGLARASRVLWPADLPKPETGPQTLPLTPYLSPNYIPHEAPERPPSLARELPETYLLYHGPITPDTVQLILGAWRWGAEAIGQLYPLMLAGLNPIDREQVEGQIHRAGLDPFCQVLPIVPIADIPALYQGSTALFHPAPSAPWGGAIRRAMACGRPVVTIENRQADALVGEAGYVLPPGDLRRLGAALITVVVEASVAEKLGQLGRVRAAPWQEKPFGENLKEIYLRMTSGK
jgi:glycosyltransferase involved in cell wall biosynthesis